MAKDSSRSALFLFRQRGRPFAIFHSMSAPHKPISRFSRSRSRRASMRVRASAIAASLAAASWLRSCRLLMLPALLCLRAKATAVCSISISAEPHRQLLPCGQGEEADLGVRHGANQLVTHPQLLWPRAGRRRTSCGAGESGCPESPGTEKSRTVVTIRLLVWEPEEPMKVGVRNAAGLSEVGLGDAKVLQRGLKVPVVDQGDPRRRLRGQFVLQDVTNQALDCLRIRRRANETGLLAGSFTHPVRHVDESAPGIDGGAACSGRAHQRDERQKPLHFFSLAFLTRGMPQIGHFPGFGSAICGCIRQV